MQIEAFQRQTNALLLSLSFHPGRKPLDGAAHNPGWSASLSLLAFVSVISGNTPQTYPEVYRLY